MIIYVSNLQFPAGLTLVNCAAVFSIKIYLKILWRGCHDSASAARLVKANGVKRYLPRVVTSRSLPTVCDPAPSCTMVSELRFQSAGSGSLASAERTDGRIVLMSHFSFQPPKSKSKKAAKGKSSAVVDGLSTEEMSKDQVRAAARCWHMRLLQSFYSNFIYLYM